MRLEKFRELYEEHAGALYSFLAYRTGSPAAAEDLLADTFERALRARRRFDPRRGSEKTWLYAIATNCARNYARDRATESRAVERVGSEPPTPDTSLEERALDRDELMRGLTALSEEEREALALRFGADLTMPEIARLKGEKLTTIEGRVYRGLRRLRDGLG